MPRMYDTMVDERRLGSLAIEAHNPDRIEVFYVPSKDRIEQSVIARDRDTEYRAKLLEIGMAHRSLTILLTNTNPDYPEFLESKYCQITRITLKDYRPITSYLDEVGLLKDDDIMLILEVLPSCFVKDYDYGLGFIKSHRFIVNAVEDLSSCTEIVISQRHETGIDENNNAFCISDDDFETIRKAITRTINTTQAAARSVNAGQTYNLLAERVGKPLASIKTGRSPLRRRITQVALTGEDVLSEKEQDGLLKLVANSAREIARARPGRVSVLRSDLQLVALESLIEHYRQMMRMKLPERKWQDFLDDNSFVLNLAFGYPVVKIRGQASVGGHRLSGGGDRIADFLVRHGMTGNSAIVEIKRPQTKLLNARSVRNGVYTPSGDLVGAINQILDQKYQFERDIVSIRDKSEAYDIQSYSIACCLIIGTMPEDRDRIKSFEIFRGNSKHVNIVTFDELLENLKELRQFLGASDVQSTGQSQPIEPPF